MEEFKCSNCGNKFKSEKNLSLHLVKNICKKSLNQINTKQTTISSIPNANTNTIPSTNSISINNIPQTSNNPIPNTQQEPNIQLSTIPSSNNFKQNKSSKYNKKNDDESSDDDNSTIVIDVDAESSDDDYIFFKRNKEELAKKNKKINNLTDYSNPYLSKDSSNNNLPDIIAKTPVSCINKATFIPNKLVPKEVHQDPNYLESLRKNSEKTISAPKVTFEKKDGVDIENVTYNDKFNIHVGILDTDTVKNIVKVLYYECAECTRKFNTRVEMIDHIDNVCLMIHKKRDKIFSDLDPALFKTTSNKYEVLFFLNQLTRMHVKDYHRIINTTDRGVFDRFLLVNKRFDSYLKEIMDTIVDFSHKFTDIRRATADILDILYDDKYYYYYYYIEE